MTPNADLSFWYTDGLNSSRMLATLHKCFKKEHIGCIEWQDIVRLGRYHGTFPMETQQAIYSAYKEPLLQLFKQAKSKILAPQDEQAVLNTYISEWKTFSTHCTLFSTGLETLLEETLPSITMQNYTVDSTKREFLYERWNLDIFSKTKYTLLFSALKLVYEERNGQVSDSQFIACLFSSILESVLTFIPYTSDTGFQIYLDEIEKIYTEDIKNFHYSKAELYLEQHGVKEYMKYANQKLNEEEIRVSKYLELIPDSISVIMTSSARMFNSFVKDMLLVKCPEMILNNETEELQLMHKLIYRDSDDIELMLRDFKLFIMKQGLADMTTASHINTQDSAKYVEQLLEFFTRISKQVKESFNEDPRFYTTRDKAFQQVVNDISVFPLKLPEEQKGESGNKTKPQPKCLLLLACYCDMLLRKTILSKKLNSNEIDKKLEQVVSVLKYIENKDAFINNYYKTHLTQRLLLGLSTDSEKEKDMVQRLRNIGMPADSIKKISTMLDDMTINETFNQEFKDAHKSTSRILPYSFNVKILNGYAWFKSNDAILVTLPAELETYIPEVDRFYGARHSHRKLQWCHKVSTGTITFITNIGKFDLDVTAFQLAVLFIWNGRDDKISFADLGLATKLIDKELRRTLWSLVTVQKLNRQPLLYEPEVKSPEEFNANTLFWVNEDFAIIKDGKPLKHGKVNLIGRLRIH